MPVFNVAKLNPKFRKKSVSEDYGFLINRLEIKKNNLGVDDVLSEGDYDECLNDVYKAMSNPNLTDKNRSDLTVMISKLNKDKSVISLRKSSDMGRLKREFDDDMRTNVKYYGNNPKKFLENKEQLLFNQIIQLNEVIDQTFASEGDVSIYRGKLDETKLQWENANKALDILETHIPGEAPKSGMIASIKTNDDGQLVDIDISRGGKTGYLSTNAVWGGFRVEGKLNMKDGDENVFLLGDDRYQAPDVIIPNLLTGEMKRSTLNYVDPANPDIRFSEGKMHDVKIFDDAGDSLISTQGNISADGWGIGSSGNIYHKHADETNTKYTGSAAIKKMEELEAMNTRLLPLNRIDERSISSFSTDTISEIDIGMPETAVSEGQQMIGPQLPPTAQTPISEPPVDAGVTSQPVSPTIRASQTTQGVAEQTQKSATGFLGRVGQFFRSGYNK